MHSVNQVDLSIFQFKMIGATKELQQDHTFSSRPEQWPLMKRGVAYWLDRESNVCKRYLHIICP